MNDATVFVVGGLVAVLIAFVCHFVANIYRGVHGSLANASIGDVYNFLYRQPLTGTCERYLAKVLNIRKLDNYEINRLNWVSDYRTHDKNFLRTNTLVTCEMSNGDIRQFYAERCDKCKRSFAGNMLFKAGIAYLF